MFKRNALVGAIAAVALLVGASPVGAGSSGTGGNQRYLVVFAGDYAVDSTYAVGGGYAVLCNYAVLNGYAVTCDYAVAEDYAVSLVEAAGGAVTSNMLDQIGVLVVESPNALFADLVRTYAVVQDVGQDFAAGSVPDGGPEQTEDPLESQQWGMQMIQAPDAHAIQAGARSVEVGILDTGVDGYHLDFKDDPSSPLSATNVACERGRNSVAFVTGGGPGAGVADPCVDNGFHGTHVAGIVGAQANDHGVVGVAPNVTLVPVKVCDTTGHCYASAVVDGITYSGDQKFEVINMSFFVDDDQLLQSTEFKCMDDPQQRAFRRAVERAIQYARSQGVVPVAALGNSDKDLAHPAEGNQCDVVPAESSGVIGTMALGRTKAKAGYSNYGSGATDVAAPGGTGTGTPNGILSTFPANTWAAISGTSMASPHAAGVAALIVSQFGTLGPDGDVKMSPTSVESILQSTTIDQGLVGYDECFGHGRINALRAVTKVTSKAYDAAAPFCPEYDQ